MSYYDGSYNSPYEDPSRDEWAFLGIGAAYQEQARNEPGRGVAFETVEEGPDILHGAYRSHEQGVLERQTWGYHVTDSYAGYYRASCDGCGTDLYRLDSGHDVDALKIEESWAEVRPGAYDLVDAAVYVDVCCDAQGCEKGVNEVGENIRRDIPVKFKHYIYSRKDCRISLDDGYDERRAYKPSRFEDPVEALMDVRKAIKAKRVTISRQLISPVSDDSIYDAIKLEAWILERKEAARIESDGRKFRELDVSWILADLFGTTVLTDIGMPTFYRYELDKPHDEAMVAQHSTPEDDRFIDPQRILTADELMGELDGLRREMGY